MNNFLQTAASGDDALITGVDVQVSQVCCYAIVTDATLHRTFPSKNVPQHA